MPTTSAASPAAKNTTTAASPTTCNRLSRSSSARVHVSGTCTKRPAPEIASPLIATMYRASPPAPTTMRGSPKTNDQSVRAGRCCSSAATTCSGVASTPKRVCSARCAERLRRLARQVRAGTRLRQRMRHRAHGTVVGDRDPPLLRALDDVAAEHRVANFPERRLRASCRRGVDTLRGPLRARRTCATSTAADLRSRA